MSWLSTKWDELSGKNQKVSTKTVNSEYDTAFKGARDTYGTLEQRGMDMMDPDSAYNMEQRAGMQESAADAAAEGSRLAGRNAAMAGGAPTAALAAQTADFGNKAQAGASSAYNQYLSGAISQGAGMASGAANNMAQMNQTQMNAVSNQRLANSQIDSQATGLGANLLGKGLQMGFGMLKPPVPGMQEGGKMPMYQQGGGVYTEGNFEPHMMYKDNDSMMAKTYQSHLSLKDKGYGHKKMANGGKVSMYANGGYVESAYGNSGGMLSQVMGPDGIPMNIKTRIGGQTVGE